METDMKQVVGIFVHRLLVAAVLLAHAAVASAAWVGINPPAGNVVLFIGPVSGPAGAAVPTVTFTPTAAQYQLGVPVAGTPQIQIEYSVQRPGGGGQNLTATLRANAANLTSGANVLNITDVSWTTAAITGGLPAQPVQLIPGGTFVLGSQVIDTLTTTSNTNFYAGAVVTYHFTPSQAYPAGTYTGSVSYTVSRSP